MAEVRLDRVNKVYEGHGQQVHAVRDLDLVVNDGEFVSIVGPSGCGKSTTLRVIVGLEQATTGHVRFDGASVNDLDPQARNVAMAFENYALYPNFSAEENVGFPLEARGVPKPERRRRVRQLAELLQIEHILHQRPNTLSGGQKQRVSLARALIREPAAFILDEVLGHVDGHLRFQMLFDLKRLHQSLDSTMIFVTHDQMEAIALSDRIAVLHQGRLIQCGTRDELYDTPATKFVADFVGEPPTNFFDVRFVEEGGAEVLRADDLALTSRPRKPQRGCGLGAMGAMSLASVRKTCYARRERARSVSTPQSTSMNISGSDPSSPCAGAGTASRPWRRPRMCGPRASRLPCTTGQRTSWCSTRTRRP